MIGRRGPLQTAFTTLELRELGELDNVDVIVDPAQLEGVTDEDAAAAGKTAKQNISVLRDYAKRSPRPGHRRIVLRFMTSPIEIKGDGRVESIVLGRNELVTDETGRVSARDTGEREELPVQLVVRSVGYRGVPTPGCRSTRRRRPSPTPAAGSRAAATSTWWGGSSAGRPASSAPIRRTPRTPWTRCSPTWPTPARTGWPTFGRPRRPAGRLAGVTSAEAGHHRALGAHRRARAGGRRGARAPPRQAAQFGQVAAGQPRLSGRRRRREDERLY